MCTHGYGNVGYEQNHLRAVLSSGDNDYLAAFMMQKLDYARLLFIDDGVHLNQLEYDWHCGVYASIRNWI